MKLFFLKGKIKSAFLKSYILASIKYEHSNDATYKHSNLYKICCILSYIKIYQKLINFAYLKIYILRSTRFSSLCSQNHKIFEIDILHIYGINQW
jgi:hypothetical protein